MKDNSRKRSKVAQRLFVKPVGEFKQVDLSIQRNVPKWMTRCFKNNRYLVMIDDNASTTSGFAIRAMVQRHDANPIDRHWSEMQKIKNELFGEEVTAIEYYPKKSELIDAANIYWLWIYPDNIIPTAINL